MIILLSIFVCMFSLNVSSHRHGDVIIIGHGGGGGGGGHGHGHGHGHVQYIPIPYPVYHGAQTKKDVIVVP